MASFWLDSNLKGYNTLFFWYRFMFFVLDLFSKNSFRSEYSVYNDNPSSSFV